MADIKNTAPHREPLVRIARRDALPWYISWAIRLGSIIAALICASLITIILTGENPMEIFRTMVDGNFGTERKIWTMLRDLSFLLCISLAVTPAFRMRFWNIGAEGQVLMGGLCTAACMINLGGKVPDELLIPIMAVAAIIGGAVWGIIPAIFKAYWNTNETLFTLMMNYVAMQIISYFIVKWESPKGSGTVGVINLKNHYGWFPKLFDSYYAIGVIVVAVLTVAIYIYMKKSKQGYEISVVGESENTARYIGINVKKVIIRTMAISGALCGLAGLLIVGGADHTISTATAGGRGFTAIMVSWLAKFNPIIMVFTSLLLVFMQRGAGSVSTVFGLNKSFSDIITAVILLFIIGSEFLVEYKLIFRTKEKEVE